MSVQGHTQDLQKWDSTLVILKFNELSVIHFLYPNVHLSYQGGGGRGGRRRGAVFLCVQQETPLSMALYISFSLVNVKKNNILNRKYY